MAGEPEFLGRLRGAEATVAAYESVALQAEARALIPLSTLKARACATVLGSILSQPLPTTPSSFADALVFQLARWFKTEFFSWVNSPPCVACGGATEGAGARAPSAEEALGGASRVEAYACSSCGAETRFPRYNDCSRLLKERRGRCGEWANAFTLLCRSLGFRARYVLDWSDHVWTEVYSPSLRRWVHVDSCEAAWDVPLLYEDGWGKKLAYVMAVSAREGVVDVTPRYVLSWAETLLRRRLVPEAWLARVTGQSAMRAVSLRPPHLREAAALRLREELAELQAMRSRTSVAAAQALPGRQSGSRAWVEARGEGGEEAARRRQRRIERAAALLAQVLRETGGDLK